MLGPIGAFGINKDPKAGGRRNFHTINILRVPTGIPCGREVREVYVSFCMLPGTAQGQIKAQVSPIANSVGAEKHSSSPGKKFSTFWLLHVFG